MAYRFNVVNKTDIPDDLPPGEYSTEVIGVDHDTGMINIRFLGKPYDPDNPCLIKLTKEAANDEKQQQILS